MVITAVITIGTAIAEDAARAAGNKRPIAGNKRKAVFRENDPEYGLFLSPRLLDARLNEFSIQEARFDGAWEWICRECNESYLLNSFRML